MYVSPISLRGLSDLHGSGSTGQDRTGCVCVRLNSGGQFEKPCNLFDGAILEQILSLWS